MSDADLRDKLARKKAEREAAEKQAKEAAKPKPTIKRTVPSSGYEKLDLDQLEFRLDHVTVNDDRGRVVGEFQKRFAKYNLTHGHITRLGREYAEIKYGIKIQSEPELETEEPVEETTPQPEPEPVEETPQPEPEPVEPEYNSHQSSYQQATPEVPPLSLAIIKEIEIGRNEFAPYLQEIWDSKWDYIDRRDSSKPSTMYSDAITAKSFVETHKGRLGDTVDDFVYEAGHSKQKGLCMIILNAYLFWKNNHVPF